MELLETLRRDVIGERQCLATPFGERPLVYADYTASGRSLASVEAFIRQRVLPLYANTHSDSSLTGRQSTRLREQARQLIRRSIGAQEEHAVLFCGSGATAAINRLIALLGLQLPADAVLASVCRAAVPEAQRPVVFIGPYEHHSNELPWRESLCTVVRVPLDEQGGLSLSALAQNLHSYRDRPLKIGSFSAASNVTGIKTDVPAVNALLEAAGALRCWDYAAAGPYLEINMRDKDAVFLSPHKFLGGPGTPGILVCRRDLARNRVPSAPGGGTVRFVTPDEHDYHTDLERREEGGTPGIVEAVRAGLVFAIKDQVGASRIEALESELLQRVWAAWQRNTSLRILGGVEQPRLGIVSFQILSQGRPLHYAYVVALLNDLFGIQARGGCSCAGPYGHRLLALDEPASEALRAQVLGGHTVLRPGWVRINFNYFIDQETCDYLIQAVLWIARHGAKLLSWYRYDQSSGRWQCRYGTEPPLVSLGDFQLGQCEPQAAKRCSQPLAHYLADADALLEALGDCPPVLDASFADLERAGSCRWFFLPQDASERSVVQGSSSKT